MFPRRAVAMVTVLLAGAPLAACAEAPSTPTSGYHPSSLSGPEDAEIRQVTLTEEGARRTGLQTTTVRTSGDGTAVPYGSVIYDSGGKTYVYTSPQHLRFVRREVEIETVTNDVALLKKGPAVGTTIVTVGVAEVYGTEFEVGH